jgi:hypothetical protein
MKPLAVAGAGCLLAVLGIAVSDGVANDRVPSARFFSAPDAPNRADFPSTLLRAGELWQHQIQYQFTKGVAAAN